MKNSFLLATLLAMAISSTVALAMEEEERPLWNPIPVHHQSSVEQWEAGKVQGYPGVLSELCAFKPLLCDFSDTEKSYLISPICFEEASQRPGKVFFRNNKCFQITNIHKNCSLLINYQPSERLLTCFPLSEHPKAQQNLQWTEGWFCAAMVNNGQSLDDNTPTYFEIRKVESTDTNSRAREDDDIFGNDQQGASKKLRELSNQMDGECFLNCVSLIIMGNAQ